MARPVHGAALRLPDTHDVDGPGAAWAVDNGYAERYTYHAARKVNGRYVDEERVRWFPGIDVERVMFHAYYGKPAPANRTSSAAQFNYPAGAGKTRAEQKATAIALVTA